MHTDDLSKPVFAIYLEDETGKGAAHTVFGTDTVGSLKTIVLNRFPKDDTKTLFLT